MAFLMVLLYLAVVFIRPGEIIPGWNGVPIAAITEVSALFFVAIELAMKPRKLLNQPHDRYVAGFFAAAVLSNPSWGWFAGGVDAFNVLLPTMLCYLMLRCGIRSPGQIRWAGYVLVALTLFQAVNGIQQFRTGVGLGGVAALKQNVGGPEEDYSEDPDAKPKQVMRIQGTGIFNDPNDLAMAFVGIMPFLIGPMLTKGRGFAARALAVSVSAPIVVALIFTNSRGGVLGLAAVLAQYIWRSKSNFAKFIAVAALVALFAFGPSRSGEMDAGESSAQGRVQSWSAGLQMLKMRPILGVGFGRYIDYHEIVAHNSFVHTLGELGFVGGFCFVGMFYWVFRGIATSVMANPTDHHLDSFLSWGGDLRVGTIGLLVCSWFLSRQYVPPLYIWIALGGCYRQAMEDDGTVKVTRSEFKDTGRIAAVTVGGILVVYVSIRLLAVWGG